MAVAYSSHQSTRSTLQKTLQGPKSKQPSPVKPLNISNGAALKNISNAASSLHETDLMKIVIKIYESEMKQTIKKNASSNNNNNMQEGKTDKSPNEKQEQFKALYKAWSGYTKYLRSQVLDKKRVVVCPILGIFSPWKFIQKEINPEDEYSEAKDTDSNSQVCYAPSIEFIENLKLSYQEDNINNLNPYTNLSHLKHQLVKVSFGSIAAVSDMNEGVVQQLLRLIFQSIEIGLKKNLSIKLNLKVGFLRISNGELKFENLKRASNFQKGEGDLLSISSCNTFAKSQRRHMIRSFFGNNDAYSFTNRSHSNRFSIKTPQTYSNLPTGSQVSLESRQVGSARFINMSNPNPQAGSSQFARLTRAQISHINKLNGITVPGFPGLYSNGVHYRFGKKVCFDTFEDSESVIKQVQNGDHKQQLLEHLQQQMSVKREERDREREGNRQAENELLKELREQLIRDKKKKYEMLLRLRGEFIKENSQKKKEKEEKDEQEKSESKEYRINFFPFTHGEQVENRRKVDRFQQKEELKEYLNRTQSVKAGSHSRKGSQSHWLSHNGYVTATSSNLNNSFGGKISTDYITQYPQFLKPSKLYPHRRTDDSHVKNAMEIALERYEKDLIQQQKQKDQALENIKKAVQQESQEMQLQRRIKEKHNQENQRIIEYQIQEKKQRDQQENSRLKEQVRTNIGPEQTDSVYSNLKENELFKKKVMKQDLLKQIEEKKAKVETEKKIDKIEELQNLASASLVLINERRDLIEKERIQKQIYKKAWLEQMQIKHSEKIVNNELLTGDKTRR